MRPYDASHKMRNEMEEEEEKMMMMKVMETRLPDGKFDTFLCAWRNPRKGRDQILQRSVAEP